MPGESSTVEQLDVGFDTAVGHVREHNEDSLKVDRDLGLFVVADGMGGHNAGERASHLAVETLQAQLQVAAARGLDGTRLRECFLAANRTILDESLAEPERRGMGTTMTALLLTSDRYWIGHVGDSRAWLVRDNACRQITLDHSVLGEQLRMGVITAAQAQNHPLRNVLTRSLGNLANVEVDVLEGSPRPRDTWVLGTDGMTQVIDEARIADVVAASSSASVAARCLCEIACQEDGTDNVTVVVVRCRE